MIRQCPYFSSISTLGIGYNLSRNALALVCAIVILWPVHVRAQEVTPLTLNGVDGVWFPDSEARVALAARVEAQSLARRLHLTEETLALADEEAASLRRIIAANGAQMEATSADIEEAIARAVAAEQERDAWYRNPWLWGVIGLVVGAGVVLAAVFGAGA
jgi:hypothetical protein